MTGNSPYENLAAAIVETGIRDYYDILTQLSQDIEDEDDRKVLESDKKALERFFRSGWFGMLTNLDGDVLIENIKRRVLQEAALC